MPVPLSRVREIISARNDIAGHRVRNTDLRLQVGELNRLSALLAPSLGAVVEQCLCPSNECRRDKHVHPVIITRADMLARGPVLPTAQLKALIGGKCKSKMNEGCANT